ncbi:hypothetical protein [Streptomyces rimosus]|uniref:hypothetical protein n=1 Tax=Streptomyces rimosus TaxID=1927 RepID=UPI000AA72F6C|nr:hypothetical protein [Streptomyces rimosus]
MFTDTRKALDTESLDLAPPGADQHSAAAVVVARHARDKNDLAGLLGALGLPRTEDDLVRLLPHLPRADAIPTGDPMLTEAPTTYTAVAASVLRNSDDPEHVRTTLGLSADELAAAHRRHADASGRFRAGTHRRTRPRPRHHPDRRRRPWLQHDLHLKCGRHTDDLAPAPAPAPPHHRRRPRPALAPACGPCAEEGGRTVKRFFRRCGQAPSALSPADQAVGYVHRSPSRRRTDHRHNGTPPKARLRPGRTS